LPDTIVTSPQIRQIRSRFAPLRDALLAHPVYDRIDGIGGLKASNRTSF